MFTSSSSSTAGLLAAFFLVLVLFNAGTSRAAAWLARRSLRSPRTRINRSNNRNRAREDAPSGAHASLLCHDDDAEAVKRLAHVHRRRIVRGGNAALAVLLVLAASWLTYSPPGEVDENGTRWKVVHLKAPRSRRDGRVALTPVCHSIGYMVSLDWLC